MQLLLIAQTQLCLLGSARINFCINFGHYDLRNDVTSTPQIWYCIPISDLIQDYMVESTKKPLKIDIYLYLCKGEVFHNFGSRRSKKQKEL